MGRSALVVLGSLEDPLRLRQEILRSLSLALVLVSGGGQHLGMVACRSESVRATDDFLNRDVALYT